MITLRTCSVAFFLEQGAASGLEKGKSKSLGERQQRSDPAAWMEM